MILGMDWLPMQDGTMDCARGAISLINSLGEEMEYVASLPLVEEGSLNQMKGTPIEEIRVVSEFPNVFLADLPGMPLDLDIEFLIDLLPRTSPISKRPYRMAVNELEELKKQLR